MTTVNGATNGAHHTTTSGLAGSGTIAENFDNFLKLLTTQLQNQDPTDPLDTNQFTEQLVSFTQVEQALATNSKLDQLVGLLSTNAVAGAVGYIGNTVEVPGDQIHLKDGAAAFVYELGGKAESTKIRITNEQGVTVRTLDGNLTAGRHEVAWDGRDESGNPLPEGVYNISVVAVDGDDKTVQTATSRIAEVTGVEGGSGGVLLNLGPLKVNLNDVTAIRGKAEDAAA